VEKKIGQKNMKSLMPPWAIPVNIFQILGTTCCSNMAREFARKNLSKHHLCYDATSIFEANMLVIWGSLSSKLSVDITTYLTYLPKNSFLLHINGCDNRIHNKTSTSTITNFKINKTLSQCLLDKTDLAQLIFEARRCLKA
jgi:hypothetical protein